MRLIKPEDKYKFSLRTQLEIFVKVCFWNSRVIGFHTSGIAQGATSKKLCGVRKIWLSSMTSETGWDVDTLWQVYLTCNKENSFVIIKDWKTYFVRSGNFLFMHLCISLYALQTYVLDLFSSVLDLEWPCENAMYSQLSV